MAEESDIYNQPFVINYSTLPDVGYSTETATGRISPKNLGSADVFLPISETSEDEPVLRRLNFDDFQILPPPKRHNPEARHKVVSLLGMDVLQNFTHWLWDWDQGKLFLDS